MDIESSAPKVFISYSHNYDRPDYKDRILELANRLRADGIDCNIDQYEESPAEGWPRWMLNQIDWANFVLIACTQEYERRFRGNEAKGKGKGGTWEGGVIIDEIYHSQGNNSKFIPIALNLEDSQYIPSPLRSATHYKVDNDSGYELLCRRLTNQPKINKPSLGKLQTLPPRDRKQNFMSIPKSQAKQKKIDPIKAAKEKKRVEEVSLHTSKIKSPFTNVEEVVKSLGRLGVIGKGDPKAIESVSALLTVSQKSFTIASVAIEIIKKIAKGDDTAAKTAAEKVMNMWGYSKDIKFKKSIIQCVGQIGNKNDRVINKLISILNLPQDSVIIQEVAKSLAKIAVGYRNIISAIEYKIKIVPSKPKILRDTLVRSLKRIDPGNKVAERYTQ
jgi:SEFIR domain